MKKTLLILLSVLSLVSFSQKKDKSSSFDIPGGSTDIKQLSNGNTVLVEITKKEGIKVLLFDTLRKKISTSKLGLKLIDEKIGTYIYEGLFEIAGDPVLFIQIGKDRVPLLIRIIIDGKTGKLKSEEQVSQLDKIKGGAGYAVVFGGVDIPDFEITKDPDSDYYALVRYNSFAEDTKDRIEVIHYSPQHKVINRANYSSPDNEFKYLRYLSTYVSKDKYVVLATYGFNTNKTGGEKGRFYVSQLSNGKTSLKQQELSFTNFYKDVECTFQYNKTKQMLNMILITNVSSSKKSINYEYHFQNINPTTLKIEKEYVPDFTQVNDYYRNKMERKDDFNGLLRKSDIDKNGNAILFYQEYTKSVSKEGTVRIYLGDVALLTVSPSGKTIGSAVFPASMITSVFQALDMVMIVGDKNTYVLFNNSLENMERPETQEAKTIKARGIVVPVKYTYANSSINKEYVFKAPKEKKGNPYFDLSAWDYSSLSKKFVSIYLDPEKDKACLMYVNLD